MPTGLFVHIDHLSFACVVEPSWSVVEWMHQVTHMVKSRSDGRLQLSRVLSLDVLDADDTTLHTYPWNTLKQSEFTLDLLLSDVQRLGRAHDEDDAAVEATLGPPSFRLNTITKGSVLTDADTPLSQLDSDQLLEHQLYTVLSSATSSSPTPTTDTTPAKLTTSSSSSSSSSSASSHLRPASTTADSTATPSSVVSEDRAQLRETGRALEGESRTATAALFDELDKQMLSNELLSTATEIPIEDEAAQAFWWSAFAQPVLDAQQQGHQVASTVRWNEFQEAALAQESLHITQELLEGIKPLLVDMHDFGKHSQVSTSAMDAFCHLFGGWSSESVETAASMFQYDWFLAYCTDKTALQRLQTMPDEAAVVHLSFKHPHQFIVLFWEDFDEEVPVAERVARKARTPKLARMLEMVEDAQ